MNDCSSKHVRVIFSGAECPMCSILEELGEVRRMQRDLEQLVDRLDAFSSQLKSPKQKKIEKLPENVIVFPGKREEAHKCATQLIQGCPTTPVSTLD